MDGDWQRTRDRLRDSAVVARVREGRSVLRIAEEFAITEADVARIMDDYQAIPTGLDSTPAQLQESLIRELEALRLDCEALAEAWAVPDPRAAAAMKRLAYDLMRDIVAVRAGEGMPVRRSSPVSPSSEEGGVVYVIEAVGSGRVKIGVSTDPDKRLRTLRTASPHGRLRILLTREGGRAEEARLHEEFAEYREHGEWFRCEGRLAEWLGIEPKKNVG